MRIGISGPQDVIALLIRRKWWIIGPFLAMSSVLAILVNYLPEVFVSTTLILVNPRDVPENMVIDLISGSAESRLKAVEQIVLSRNNLKQILDEFGGQLPNFKRYNLDAQIQRLREDIKIQFQIEKSQNYRTESTINFFRLSYQNEDAFLAQKITKKLVDLFLFQDRSNREAQVNGTTEFLSVELEKVKALMDASGEELKQVKADWQFELPENLDVNLKALDRLQLDKQGNILALDRSITRKVNAEAQIAQTPEFLLKPAAAPNAAGRGPAAAPAPPKDPLLEEFRKAKEEYDKQAALNRPRHPDVLKALERLDRVKAKMPPEVLELALKGSALDTPESVTGSIPETDVIPAADRVPNPAFERMVAELRNAETELASREKERRFIENEILKYTARVNATPQAELKIADVERENKDLQRRYQDLNGKLGQAKLSESLETVGKGQVFFVQDEANHPLDAAKPNKQSVLLGSCLFSLALSIAFAFVVDVARQRVRTQTEIEAIWGVPVLIDVPELVTDSDLAAMHKKKVRFAMYASMAVVLQVSVLYFVYLKHVYILTTLEPVLQKLVYR